MLPIFYYRPQGNIFRSVCQEFCPQGGWYALHQVSGGGVVPQHALQVSRPTPKGKFRGILSRPIPKGEVEGDLARGGACLGVPAPGRCLPGGGVAR